MKNFRYSGDSISWTQDENLIEPLKSGSGIMLKDIFGVTSNTIQKIGDKTEVFLVGAYILKKVKDTNEIAVGQKLYWDLTAKRICANYNEGDKKVLVGVATEKRAGSDETVEVRLNGVPG